jgi:hypothetical protein
MIYVLNYSRWSLSPISVMNDIGLCLISEPPISDSRQLVSDITVHMSDIRLKLLSIHIQIFDFPRLCLCTSMPVSVPCPCSCHLCVHTMSVPTSVAHPCSPLNQCPCSRPCPCVHIHVHIHVHICVRFHVFLCSRHMKMNINMPYWNFGRNYICIRFRFYWVNPMSKVFTVNVCLIR